MQLDNGEIAQIAHAGPLILKMLRRREQMILDKIFGEFRAGKTDHTASLAEYCSVRDQISELTSALAALQKKGK